MVQSGQWLRITQRVNTLTFLTRWPLREAKGERLVILCQRGERGQSSLLKLTWTEGPHEADNFIHAN